MRTIIAAVAIAAALALSACNSPTIPPGNYGSIAGTITDTSGHPLAGAVVTADYGPSDTSGPDGKYTIKGVPVHPATSPAHVAVTPPSGYRAPPPRDDVVVVAGQTTQNINFVLSRG